MSKIFSLFIFLNILLCYETLLSGYEKPSHLDEGTWDLMSPYFLPENHPVKSKLDAIFSSRATRNNSALKKAGFTTPEPRKYSHTVVTTHPNLKGYYLKFYTDETPLNDVYELRNRVIGANLIREAVNRHGFQSFLLVPKKWIYPLPVNPPPSGGCSPKNFVLIAEDMDVLKGKSNYFFWKSNMVSKKFLDAVYMIVQELGLDDSITPSNIPFTKKGILAFVDTPSYHRWPVDFSRLTSYLSPTMKEHWKVLIDHNGP